MILHELLIGTLRVCTNVTYWKLLLHAGIESLSAITLNMNKQWKERKERCLSLQNLLLRDFLFSFQISLQSSRNVITQQTLQIFPETGLISAKTKAAALEHDTSANVANSPATMKRIFPKESMLLLFNQSGFGRICHLHLGPVAELQALFSYSALTHHPWHGPSNLCFYPTGRCCQFPNLGFIWSPCLTATNSPAIFRLVLCSISFQGKCQSL